MPFLKKHNNLFTQHTGLVLYRVVWLKCYNSYLLNNATDKTFKLEDWTYFWLHYELYTRLLKIRHFESTANKIFVMQIPIFYDAISL